MPRKTFDLSWLTEVLRFLFIFILNIELRQGFVYLLQTWSINFSSLGLLLDSESHKHKNLFVVFPAA